MSGDPSYPLYPVIAFISFVLVLVPLPWHFHAWNSGTCYYMLWTSLACLNFFVNSIVWSNNVLNVAPIWCDISTRIIIGASVGIPCASLCINRRLYKIARSQAVSVTRSDKRRDVLIDTVICVVFPSICLVFSYIVQGHRFDIFETLGCYPAIYNTLPAYFLVYMWPIVIGLVSAICCILTLKILLFRQAQFKRFLSASGLTTGRYLRLMALAMTDIFFTVPLGAYEVYSNAAGGAVQPWQGWANAHYNFSRVDQYPAIIWMSDSSLAVPLQLSRWSLPLCAVVFFAFFGFAEEARKNYCSAWRRIQISVVAAFDLLWRVEPSLSRTQPLPVYSPPTRPSYLLKADSSDMVCIPEINDKRDLASITHSLLLSTPRLVPTLDVIGPTLGVAEPSPHRNIDPADSV